MAEQTTTQRRIGFAVILALALTVALVQIVGSRQHDEDGIDKGIRQLALAAAAARDDRLEHLAKAEHAFGASVGTLVIEPQAIIGLEVAEHMLAALNTPLPAAPDAAGLDEKAAAAHVANLLAHGKPALALDYLGRPEVRSRAGRGLAALMRFSERWVAAERTPAAH